EEAARAARRQVEQAARRQREKIPSAGRTKTPAGPPQPLAVGDRVRIESLGRTGQLVELRDRKAVVETGGIRMQIAADDLSVLPPTPETAPAERPRTRPAGGHVRADLDAHPEIDLRGMRVGELSLHLGRALD